MLDKNKALQIRIVNLAVPFRAIYLMAYINQANCFDAVMRKTGFRINNACCTKYTHTYINVK